MSAIHHQDTSTKTASEFMDAIYRRTSYLTSTSAFLAETDHVRAIIYWLTQIDHPANIRTAVDIQLSLARAIADLDQIINDQVNHILHHPQLQQLEASWRGLWYLVAQADNQRNIKIRFLDIAWAEVCKDIERALDFDQSHLFQKIYSDEFGTAGGEPYGVVLGDYQISHKRSAQHPYDDIATLNGMAHIAAAAFAPFITSVSSEFFGLDSLATLGLPINLQSVFAQAEYTHWRALRERQDSRFIGLTLPRMLMREAYRTHPGSYKGLYFYEQFGGPADNSHSGHLWGNACYAFGGILIREFANVGWFGHIRGVPRDQLGGGLITNLPQIHFATDAVPVATKPSVEIIVTDTLERELSELGLISLCHCYDTAYSAFYSNPSIQQPKRQTTRAGDTNAKLAAMLQHVLCASRIAHYLKVMIRDKIGSFITAEECEQYLTEWLFKYTTGRDDLDWEEQARYPLRQASVSVKENPNRPGQYLCVITLVPHYQLDQMVSELELVTELMQTS